MNMTDTHLLETPNEADQVYVPVLHGAVPEKLTWVRELLGYTVNGCFKVRDSSGTVRIVKRYKSKDKPGLKAWISLN
jgi:hypothetical protein